MEKEKIQNNDLEIEKLWEELEDVPFDEDEYKDLILSEDWYHFKAGTEREEIWKWFDQKHSKGVAWLLYQKNTRNIKKCIDKCKSL